ncbi:MAG: transposase [Patescibacteria group bacterium]
MFKYPPEFSKIISVFSPLFSRKVFERAGQLLQGTILTRGKRTVCSVLRTLGLQDIKNWDLYHRVLSRAKWSPLKCSFELIQLLIKQFCQSQTLVLGMDETLERRWGPKIKTRGIYRDAVRSSKSHFVKCSGLRWICVMLLTSIPWANRIWALPFLTVLAPSQRYHKQQGKQHKKLSDWARQICFLLRRWLPDFKLIMVGDGSYAVMELFAATRMYLTWITRFRMNAALFDFSPPYRKGQQGRPPEKGARQVSLEYRLKDKNTKWKDVNFSQWYGEKDKTMQITSGTARWYRGGKPINSIQWVLVRDPRKKTEATPIVSTDLSLKPIDMVRHFVKRWRIEVTFEEVRTHLGVETQRQWADLTILRTTPILMALFSIVTLWAKDLVQMQKLTVFQTAWYQKPHPTFSDALASVRYRIWRYQVFSQSLYKDDCKLNILKLIEHLAFMAARAA